MVHRKAATHSESAVTRTNVLLVILATLLLPAGMLLSGCSSASPSGGGGGQPDISDGGNIAEPEEPEDNPLVREIEEADIVKLQDNYFYLANRYTGLRIIDAQAIERPELVGGLGVAGRGVELYVDQDRVYMVNSADFFSCAGEPLSFEDAELAASYLEPDYTGSRITIVDVSDPANPTEISHFDMDGFIVATRRVGEVLYAAGNFGGIALDTGDIDTDGDLGTDGEGEDDGLLPPSSTGEPVVVDTDGQAIATATSPGGIHAEFLINGAAPGGTAQLTVSDGNIHDDYVGIPNGRALPLTVTATGNLEDGAYVAALPIEFDATLLDEFGLSLDHWAVYRYDEQAGHWTAAATNNVAAGAPTGELGDFGFYVVPAEDDGDGEEEPEGTTTYAVWAIVDRLGDYAVGQRFSADIAITIIPSEGGTVTIDPPEGPYSYGQVVTVTAEPDEGYAFLEWTAEPAGATAPTPESLEFILTEALDIGAVFVPYTELGPHVFVVSIDISDPDNIRMVDRVDVPGESLDIHVSQNAIYVLGDDPTMADTTRVNYVDISDFAGDVEERDSFRVPGTILNRFFTDEYQGVFRIVTEEFSESVGTWVIALYTYDVSDPDNVIRLGRLGIESGESLRSVRFDGIRGYAVTFRQVDPLFVLDLADPERPVVAGQLEVPGWSTHLVPLGERLVGVGFDDTRGFRPAVALYDVANPARPRQLSRILLGDAWTFDTTSEANVDEKALKVLEEDELILIPIGSFNEDEARYMDSLQLIDLRADSLRERGLIEHRGLVRRAGVLDTRLWVLSDEAFQVADMDDRDEPKSLAKVDVVSEQELLDAGLVDCIDSAWFEGFPVEDWWLWGGGIGGGEVVVGRGACGAVGLIGLGLSFSALLALSLARPRRR